MHLRMRLRLVQPVHESRMSHAACRRCRRRRCVSQAVGHPEPLLITHRLDQATSGVLVLGKAPGFVARFNALIRSGDRAVRKFYRALTAAAPPTGRPGRRGSLLPPPTPRAGHRPGAQAPRMLLHSFARCC